MSASHLKVGFQNTQGGFRGWDMDSMFTRIVKYKLDMVCLSDTHVCSEREREEREKALIAYQVSSSRL